MIAYLLTCSLSALAGWFGHRAWMKEGARRRERLVEAQMLFNASMDVHYAGSNAFTPYETALAEYDRQIAAARAKHLKVQHIMDEKAAFVKAELWNHFHAS